MNACLDVSDVFRGQFRFITDDPFFLENAGLVGDVTEGDLVVVNQDLVVTLCERVASRYNLSCTPEAAKRIAEVADETPFKTHSFRPPFEFKKYQNRCWHALRDESRVLIQSSPGTGKTAMANSLFCDKYDRGLCGRIVVVCPAPLVTDWVNSVKTLTTLSVATTKPSWTAARRKKFYEGDSSTVWVINYEKFRCDDYEHIEKALKKDKPLFVFDEVHKVAKRTSAIHRNIAKMTRRLKASGIIAMTATPIINGPEDFYNQFRIIDPELFGGVADFERRFTVNCGEKDYWNKYLGYVNVPYLHVMAGAQVFSCNKSRPEIACEFPAKDEQLITYDLTPKMQKLYDEIFDYGHSMPMEERECALFFLEFVRLCNMPETLLRRHEYAETPYGFQLQHIDQICERYRQHILDRKQCAKLQIATEKVDELMRAGEKVIVFARHTHNCIIPLADEWKAWKPLLYTGEQSQGERDEIKKLFKRSRDRNLIIMSDAGQVGLNFQEARYLMHYDTPTSHAAYEQRSDRCLLAGSMVFCVDRGMVPIEDVKVGDRVFDAYGDIAVVTDAWSSQYEGEVVDLKVWGWCSDELSLTAEHKVLCNNGDWIQAQYLEKRDITYRGNVICGDDTVTIPLPPHDEFENVNVNPKGEHFTHPWCVNMGSQIELTPDVGFMMGYYLGDGFVAQDRCVRFAYNPSCARKVAAMYKIEPLAKWLGFSFGRYERNETQAEGYIYGKHIARCFLEWFGTGSHAKRIPDFILSSNDRKFVEAFFDGLIDSDGYLREDDPKGYVEYVTCSQTMALSVWVLARRMGWKPGIRYASASQTYVVGFCRDTKRKRIRSGSVKSSVTRAYSGTVYDITTSTGSFIANGVPVHNCHRVDSSFDIVTIIRFMGLDTVEEAIENTMWGRYQLAQEAGFQGSEYQEVPALSEGDAGWLAFGARESQDS